MPKIADVQKERWYIKQEKSVIKKPSHYVFSKFDQNLKKNNLFQFKPKMTLF